MEVQLFLEEQKSECQKDHIFPFFPFYRQGNHPEKWKGFRADAASASLAADLEAKGQTGG